MNSHLRDPVERIRGVTRVLITGGSGYIGSHVAIGLIDRHDVLSIDINDPRIPNLAHNYVDVRDLAQVRQAVDQFRPQVVIHLAAMRQARASVRQPHLYFDTNVLGTRNVAEACQDHVDRFIFTSSCSVFGNQSHVDDRTAFRPMSPYAETKVESELALLQILGSARCLILRLFNIVGAASPALMDQTGDALMRNFRKAIFLGEKLPIYGTTFPTRDGTAIREYMHVEDVADLIRLNVESTLDPFTNSPQRNVTGGEVLSVKEVADAVNLAAGRSLSDIQVLHSRQGDPAEITSAEHLRFEGWQPKRSVIYALSQEAHWLVKSNLALRDPDV